MPRPTLKAMVAHCSKCDGLSKVIDSRSNMDFITRRRRCFDCGHRWSTVEVPHDYADLYDTKARITKMLRDVQANIAAILGDIAESDKAEAARNEG